MRLFGGTGEPRELVRCMGQRARRPLGFTNKIEGTFSSGWAGKTTGANRPKGLYLSEPNERGLKKKAYHDLNGLDWRGGASQSIGQRIKRFDFVSRDPLQVGFESRVMGDYPARCIILHFPKRTFIHFFLPRRPRRLKRRDKSRPGKKKKGRWWAFGKVGPIGCLHSNDGTKEERNEVRGREARKRLESIRLDDREKQNEIRIWLKKKQRYGYHDRSPSIKKNLSKSLRVSGAFKHPKYAGVKSRSNGPTRHLPKRTLHVVRPSLNYSVMQYLLNTKNKIHFDPVVVLNHFVAPGVAEPSTMGRANAQERSLDKRIRSRIAFFVESLTSEKKCLAEAKKRLTHFIRQANDLRFAGTTKTTISFFPFFGRLKGAEIARTECGKYGKTPRNVFNQKIDYAPAEADVVGVANRTVHNLVLEDMALKVVELVVFHIEPFKQRVGL
ncbi:hypothetical protein ACH5RR_033774 [Cinchona calisaya]|uniref:Ribosomal protein S3 n=1 Tax=Cinchona calisaya TaxID=153742 RepID=A0ABD2YAA1_9GENT